MKRTMHFVPPGSSGHIHIQNLLHTLLIFNFKPSGVLLKKGAGLEIVFTKGAALRRVATSQALTTVKLHFQSQNYLMVDLLRGMGADKL